jgi:hypothetical protein
VNLVSPQWGFEWAAGFVRVGARFVRVRVRVGAGCVRVRVGAGFVRVRVGAGLVRVGAHLVRVGAGLVRVRPGFVEYWGYSLGPRPPDPSHGQAHPLSAELVVLELPVQPSQLGALAAIDWTAFEELSLVQPHHPLIWLGASCHGFLARFPWLLLPH